MQRWAAYGMAWDGGRVWEHGHDVMCVPGPSRTAASGEAKQQAQKRMATGACAPTRSLVTMSNLLRPQHSQLDSSTLRLPARCAAVGDIGNPHRHFCCTSSHTHAQPNYPVQRETSSLTRTIARAQVSKRVCKGRHDAAVQVR